MNVWVEAARPRTLPAGLVPVLVGTDADVTVAAVDFDDTGVAAALADAVSVPRLLLALVVALALQVGVNYANDYFDGVSGVDTPDRVGPRRLVAAGEVSPRAMRTATALALGVAAAAGLALAVLAGWELLLVGLAAVLAALGYSGGPRPYASRGLGEVSVFVFFGLVATVGSAYVQAGRVTALAVVAAVPVGLLAVALLVVNNLRDIPTDRATGKATLAVRLGARGTRRLYVALVAGAPALLAPLAVMAGSWWLLAPLVALPPLVAGVRIVRRGARPQRLVAALRMTARGQLAFGLVLTLALLVARLPHRTPLL